MTDKTPGLVSTTGSKVSIDRAERSTLGINPGVFVVQETGVYRNAAGDRVQQFNAGHRLSMAEAAQFQMLSDEIVEGMPYDFSIANPIEGEKLATVLRAAGYKLDRADTTITADDPPRPASTSDPVTGDAANAGASLAGTAGGESGTTPGDQPQWYQKIVAKDANAAPMREGETQAAYTERVAAEQEAANQNPDQQRTNENAPNETR